MEHQEALHDHQRLGSARFYERMPSPQVDFNLLRFNLYTALRGEPDERFENLSEVIRHSFSESSKHNICSILTQLGHISCAGAGTLKVEERDPSVTHCSDCDNDLTLQSSPCSFSSPGSDELSKTMQAIVSSLPESDKVQTVIMSVMRRLIMHDSHTTKLEINDSIFGHWCLKSMYSPSRELRMAAGRTIPVFIRPGLPLGIRRCNYITALKWLEEILEGDGSTIKETAITTLGQLAMLSVDEEMNIILSRLLESLAHPNPFISGVAYIELSDLAHRLNKTPSQLFRPFWRTLSVLVIKHLQQKPQMAGLLCDLIGMKFDHFLKLTETYALPHLVLSGRVDIIQGMASTGKQSLYDLCTSRSNLASILSFLLIQPSENHHELVTSVFDRLSPEFRVHSLAGWIRTEPVLIMCELLRGLGEAVNGSTSKQYSGALKCVATLTPRREILHHSDGDIMMDGSSALAGFVQDHILGIITEFAQIINDSSERQPTVEKRRNIVAIGELIKIAPDNIGVALPQICACLRSAFDVTELCGQAFICWDTIVRSLTDFELEPFIDQTACIIIKHWSHLGEDIQQCAYKLMGFILSEHNEVVRSSFARIPSLISIPEMAEHEFYLMELRAQLDVQSQFQAFCQRCQNENSIVVEVALEQLLAELGLHPEFIYRTMSNEQQPDNVIVQLIHSLLDCCVKFNAVSTTITTLAAECLGVIGCMDPNRMEYHTEKKDIIVLSNFNEPDETLEFVLFFLEHILVEAFLSTSNTRSQGFLAFSMQALLKHCHLDSDMLPRSQEPHLNRYYRRWLQLPEYVRNTLTPFLSSRYKLTVHRINTSCAYPLFTPQLSHAEWLRTFVLDMLHRGMLNNPKAKDLFNVASRIIRGQDLSIAAFLLPFNALNLVMNGDETELENLKTEVINVLKCPLSETGSEFRDNLILCSESIFSVLDYLFRWLQGRKKAHASLPNPQHPSKQKPQDSADLSIEIRKVEEFLSWIPAELISTRAVECKSFSRALFHWEQYIRQRRTQTDEANGAHLEPLYERLQEIYMQMDEPDGVEGIASHLHILNIDQQVLEHRKAGRWVAAQSWYGLQLEKNPGDSQIQKNLLACLQEFGQHDVLLGQFDALRPSKNALVESLPLAVEASWVTGKWNYLERYLDMASENILDDFSISLGAALQAFRRGEKKEFDQIVYNMRYTIGKGLTGNSASSFKASHDSVFKLHALCELETLTYSSRMDRQNMNQHLDQRLEILGGCVADKRYLLNLRRTIMELSPFYDESDVSAVWVRIAHLSRKTNRIEEAFNAALHASELRASELHDKSATVEHAKLLWQEGHLRKAIQTLEGVIDATLLNSSSITTSIASTTANGLPGAMDINTDNPNHQMNLFFAKAYLLLAKWTDTAGQTQAEVIQKRYRQAIKHNSKWEKAHYHLGKHYARILDSEKTKPIGKEAQTYLSGEVSKLVIESFLRSLTYGNKYVFQTFPKVLTLWFEHASAVEQPFDKRRGTNEDFQKHNVSQRAKSLNDMHKQLQKYIERIPAASLFTILSQVVARICHRNRTVYQILLQIIIRTTLAFPQQALWSVLAILKSASKEREARGRNCFQKIMSHASQSLDIKMIATHGQKLIDQMLILCRFHIEDHRVSRISLARDIRFDHKVAPCKLVIPLEVNLTPTLPPSHDPSFVKKFRAFPQEPITIETVNDEARVLNSLQKPRRISIRGSDGKTYFLLCKPNDDLRKDQRLMEYNALINRFLKRDLQSSTRQLYVKTYAVTPINEKCGLIEWVTKLQTLREIVVRLLRDRGISFNFKELRRDLDEACSDPSKVDIFTKKVLVQYPPVLHEWFVDTFPGPDSWFAARLRYTRTSAVMSMVGYTLGLGDRHGENLSFHEGHGGVLHCDFNCLFDKGLTFEKPELVPFRLTHNMVDAFGAYGYNGPFRKTCEVTLSLLRQSEDSLMTILETFVHDPTTDFIGKERYYKHPGVPHTPEEVLESVRSKLRGLLPGESIPLSVGGHVDALISEATNKFNLAAMYAGWGAYM